MNSRRLQVDYERDPIVTEGFIWAAHSRHLLRRLTQPATKDDYDGFDRHSEEWLCGR